MEDWQNKIKTPFQHCPGGGCHLRAGGRPRPHPKVRLAGGPDPQGGHHLHPPQPQQPDARQRHRPPQAPRRGGAKGNFIQLEIEFYLIGVMFPLFIIRKIEIEREIDRKIDRES